VAARRHGGRALAVALTALAMLAASGGAASAAPVVTIDHPLPGSSTNNTSPPFKGTTSDVLDPIVLSIHEGATATGPLAQESVIPAPLLEAWETAPASPLAQGQYTAVARQTNVVSETGSAEVTFTVDTVAPLVSLNPLPSLTSNATPTFTGGAGTAPGDIGSVTLKIYPGTTATGSPTRTIPVVPTGASWRAEPGLADGTYTAIAEQSDEAGNTRHSGPATFTVDTTPPSVTLNLLPPLISTPTPTFSGGAGTAEHDISTVTIKIYPGSSPSGKPVELAAIASGASWAAASSESLVDGTYTAVAEQSDEAGNTGRSLTTTFAVDTVAPRVKLLNPVSHSITNNPTPPFSGSAGIVQHDLATVTLKVYAGTAPTGVPVQRLEAKASGETWSTKAAKALPDGTYTAVAEQSDEAGNTGVSKPSTFTVKTRGPDVTLVPLAPLTNNPTPTFTGRTGSIDEHDGPVTVKIYPGSAATGTPVQTLETPAVAFAWSVTAKAALADGSYTAIAEQRDGTGNVGKSVASPFVVDATAPHVSLNVPAEGATTSDSSQLVSGTAGKERGDLEQVTVELYSGSVASGAPLEDHAVTTWGAGRSWSTTFAGLLPGSYTVRAVQLDEAGNSGASAPSTFTVTSPPPASPPPPPAPTAVAAPNPPPVASFSWLPSSPHVGDPVTLISNSSDGSEAITALAWSAAGDGAFTPGGAVITTSFAKAGAYPVQLRVTSAAGMSSVASRTIQVTSVPLVLMQPFPVVRIVGYDTAAGVTISLLSVMTPLNARVTVSCRGAGCPTRAESHVARSGRPSRGAGSVLLTFRRFARSLPAGVTLQIRVAKLGQIGKYTRFTVRRGRLPTRVDSCLDPAGIKPIACPSS
jgi:hypothetical protein